MGKHKEKKSKKHKKEKKHKKNKQKHYSDSSNDNSSGEDEFLWCDGSESKKQENTKKIEDKNDFENSDKSSINRDNVDDWLGFFEGTTSDNSRQGAVDRQKRKEDLVKAENKVRYARELNSYFRDDKKGEYIDDPEAFYKKKEVVEKEYSSSESEGDHENDSEKSEKEDEESKPLTDSERNALNAKLIKAQMFGNDESVKEIKAKLEGSSSSKMKVDVYQQKKTKQELEKSEEQMSVREMFYKTKQITARDEMMRFVSSSSKLRRTDDEYDEVRRKSKKQKTHGPSFEKLRQDNDSRCRQCLEETENQLILKFKPDFESCFIVLSKYETFIPNVCQIRSRDHSFRCSLDADENCWTEIRKAMRNISAFFDKTYKQTVIFMETHFRNQKYSQNISRKHFVIECFPIDQKYEDDARIYFHKAIMECEEEWSQNKKMIKLEEKPITSKLPKGLPYFWVSFGPNFKGFAHVIEDENHFSAQFGTEIISGLFDIDCFRWNKTNRYEKNTTNYRLQKSWKEFLSE